MQQAEVDFVFIPPGLCRLCAFPRSASQWHIGDRQTRERLKLCIVSKAADVLFSQEFLMTA